MPRLEVVEEAVDGRAGSRHNDSIRNIRCIQRFSSMPPRDHTHGLQPYELAIALICNETVGLAIKELAGDDEARQTLVIDTLRVALELDAADHEQIRKWIDGYDKVKLS